MNAIPWGAAPARIARRQQGLDQVLPDDGVDWRRVMLQSQLDLAALFIATGRSAFADLRERDYQFSRDRAQKILREVEAEIRPFGNDRDGQLSDQLRQLQYEAAVLASMEY